MWPVLGSITSGGAAFRGHVVVGPFVGLTPSGPFLNYVFPGKERVHLNSLGEPLCNPTRNRTLGLLSFQTTLKVTLQGTLSPTLNRSLENM